MDSIISLNKLKNEEELFVAAAWMAEHCAGVIDSNSVGN